MLIRVKKNIHSKLYAANQQAWTIQNHVLLLKQFELRFMHNNK